MNDDYDYVMKTRGLLQKSNLSIPRNMVDALLFDYLLESHDEAKQKSKQTIDELVAYHSPQILFSERPAFPVLGETSPPDANIRIGTVIQGDYATGDFSISPDDIQHAGSFAATGSGKTTLIAIITTQTKVPKMIFDFKRDFRGLVSSHNFKVLRWDWLRINPLEPPPNVPLTQWMTFLADVMAHVFGWYHASENYLMQFMQRAYDSSNSYPTFRTLYNLVLTSEETGRRFSEYREVVINRLSSLVIVLKDVIDTANSFPIEWLLEQNVIFEFDGLRRDEANFLVEVIVAWIFCFRLFNFQRGKISHILVFDEASRFFFKGRLYGEVTQELGLPWLEQVPLMIRDYREGLICAAQQPSLISSSLMSNLRTIFVGYLSNGEDIESISKSLNLNEEEQAELAKIGQRGMWLVKKAGMKPFVIQADDFPLSKDMNDQELRNRMHDFIAELESRKTKARPAQTAKLEAPKIIAPQLSADAWELLVNVAEHPFRGIKSRCKILKVSARRLEAAIAELLDRQMIASLQVPLGRFRPVRFLIPTDDALALLKNVGHSIGLWKKIGNIGFEHALYQVLIAYSFKKRGYEALIEKTLACGRRVDVFLRNGETRIAIEIEVTTTNYEPKLLGINEVSRLVFLVKDEKTRLEIEERLRQQVRENKINVFEITKFLRSIDTRNSSGTSGTNSSSAEQSRFQDISEQSDKN